MGVPELVADLASLGIGLEANGDRLRFFPRSAVTPDMVERLRTGDYRVQFTVAGTTVIVETMGHRDRCYED